MYCYQCEMFSSDESREDCPFCGTYYDEFCEACHKKITDCNCEICEHCCKPLITKLQVDKYFVCSEQCKNDLLDEIEFAKHASRDDYYLGAESEND